MPCLTKPKCFGENRTRDIILKVRFADLYNAVSLKVIVLNNFSADQ